MHEKEGRVMKRKCSISSNSNRVISSTLATLVVLLGLILAFPGTGLCWDGGGGSYGGYGGGGSYGTTPPKNNFAIMMNYELGMHCTGFEFSYCCVLPPYNSILAQVAKTER